MPDKQDQKQTGGAQAKDLSNVASRLKAHLTELEREYVRLEAELKKKKAARADREAADGDERARLDELHYSVKKSEAYAKKQREFLDKLKVFHERNESLLNTIADRLGDLEREFVDGAPEQAGDRERLRGELVSMLSELQTMRQRRETLLQKLQ